LMQIKGEPPAFVNIAGIAVLSSIACRPEFQS
jgi:hypothetical protein